MKLCLGTVQFGLDYGVRGKKKPAMSEAIRLLNYAVSNGVFAFDTSSLYGDAESVLGTFVAQTKVPREDLFVVSKFGTSEFDGLSAVDCAVRLQELTAQSLSQLHTDYLDAYICHVPTAVFDDRVLSAMEALKKTGVARHVGFSVYEADEALTAVKSGVIDFLQLPVSVLDQRMLNAGVLDFAQSRNVMLHARSAFVQGLGLMSPEEIPEYVVDLKPFIRRLDDLCKESQVSRRDLLFAYVKQFPQISHLVFGVHTFDQLRENLSSSENQVSVDVLNDAAGIFENVNPELVMPNKWRRK